MEHSITQPAAPEMSHATKHEIHDGVYIGVYFLLAVFTVAEIFATYVAVVRVILLLVLATTKAGLVAGYYMNLRYDKRYLVLVFVGPVVVGTLAILAIQGLVLR